MNSSNENILILLQHQALPDLLQTISERKAGGRLRVKGISGAAEARAAGDYLVEAYEKTSEIGVKCKILEALGKYRDRSRFEWLVEKVDDSQISIQCFAILALGELRDPRAVNVLRIKLLSTSPHVRMVTLDALGKSPRNPALALTICEFLDDTNVDSRFLAAKALYHVAGTESVPALAAHLPREASIEVQEALAKALGHTGGEAGSQFLITSLKNNFSQATEHWAEVGLRAVRPALLLPQLAPLLEGEDFRLKLSASRVLGELEVTSSQGISEEWQRKMKSWANGNDLIVRTAAARLMDRINAIP